MIAINMEMPESCVECRFSQGDYGFCHAMPENFCGYVYEDESEGKPEWCPLQNVQKLMAETSFRKSEVAVIGRYCADNRIKSDNISRLAQMVRTEQDKYIDVRQMDVDDPRDYKRMRSILYVVEKKEK